VIPSETMTATDKIIKFHGTKVYNIIILYSTRQYFKKIQDTAQEFDALNDPEDSETINVQVVADFVTVTFYQQESSNLIKRRELIPTQNIQHISIKDQPH
jgi:hypothetical protein